MKSVLCKALEIAEQVGYKGSIRILLDSQAAIARLQDNRTGPGQGWAIQAKDSRIRDVRPLFNGSQAIKGS
jgi:hypothetical protein